MEPGTDLHTGDAAPAAEPASATPPAYDFWPAERQAAAAKAGLRLTVDGEVAVVVLDRPQKRNAMTPTMWWQLAQMGRALPGSVRAVLLRAEGPSFSAGLDRSVLVGEDAPGGRSRTKTLIDLAASDPADAEMTIEAFQEAFTWWRRPDLVSVAAVQGHAIGAGFQLALACDLRIVADDARFAMREISLGLVPDLGGTKPLTDLVGYGRALEICATGRWIEAAEAERIGLANRVVPAAELAVQANILVRELLAADRDALIETKALIRSATERDYDAQRAAERAAQVRRIRALAQR
ncbi:enoyl-CoA hydratase/isomerase family protein [Actinocrinis puniceicyclus]|uniref:Enoyl-CoA hydratase/isomerase family protein n=1 Tax=Actinocrinis puniceicyclus TaxID=977794 RepID=A0A8J7WKV4_9ACTN|nr:enoyl-CoA hydratase/isomerase family protein [Actinocrinis puniceicyclus]MBS2961592.1 enoyl-CoA hydratase/isomerase family protein [Actinocrinis puniceicyclus]